jgi:hypothetical protein
VLVGRELRIRWVFPLKKKVIFHWGGGREKIRGESVDEEMNKTVAVVVFSLLR